MPGSTSSNGEIPIAARTELIDDIEVPATSMGPISELKVTENQLVEKDQTIAFIDEQEAMRILQQAKLKYEMALTRAQDTTSIEMAETKVKLATNEYETAYRLYQKRSRTKQEAQRAKYSMDISILELAEAKNALEIARMDAQAELVNFHAAKDSLDRHQIKSPVTGLVIQKLRDGGEWVNRGDIVLRIARLDKLYVRAVLSTETHAPHTVKSKPVVVTAMLAGREVQFDGVVARTGLEQQGDNEFLVVIEVTNRFENDEWVLLPGMFVTGRIDLNGTAPTASAENTPRPPTGSIPH